MTAIEATWLINIGLIVAGALLRSHAPVVWSFLQPIFGAVSNNPSPQPPPPPPPPTAAGPVYAPVPTPTPRDSLLAALARVAPPREEEELEETLTRFIDKHQQGRRLDRLLAQAGRENSRRQGEQPKSAMPEPSAN